MLNQVCHPRVFQGTVTNTERHALLMKAATLKDHVLQSSRSHDLGSPSALKKKSKAEQGHRGNQHKKHPREEQEVASSALPARSPCPDFWRKTNLGTRKQAQLPRPEPRSALQLQPHTPAQPCQHAQCCGGLSRITVPEPAHPVRYLLHPSFPREAVKQLQSVMPLAVTRQTVHRKA